MLAFVVGVAASVAGCRSASPRAEVGPEFDHAALHVRDVEASATFYTGALGLTRIPDPFHDGRHAFLRFGSLSQLHLIGGGPGFADRDIDVHLAIRVPSFADLLARLDRLGVTYHDTHRVPHAVTVRPDGVRQVYVQDLDGYWVEVNDIRP